MQIRYFQTEHSNSTPAFMQAPPYATYEERIQEAVETCGTPR